MSGPNCASCQQCDARPRALFSRASDTTLKQVDSNKEQLVLPKGELLFQTGEASHHFYCIGHGMVQLFRRNANREHSFAIPSAGAWIGHRDTLAGLSYQHNARSLTPLNACRLSRELLNEIMESDPVFTAAVIRDMAGGWVESEKQSYNLGARKTMERLADFLLQLRPSESAAPSELLYELPLTRETIATLLGSTTESIIRTLSDFRARGWIEIENGKVRLTDTEALARLVAE